MKTTGLTMVEAMLAYAADYEIESESCEGGHRRKNWDGEDVLFCVGETWSIVPRTFTYQEAAARPGKYRQLEPHGKGAYEMRVVKDGGLCWVSFNYSAVGFSTDRTSPDARYEEVSDE